MAKTCICTQTCTQTNASNKTLSPVERLYVDKFSEVIIYQHTTEPDKTTNTRPATQASSSVTMIVIAGTSSCPLRKSLTTTTKNQLRNVLENKLASQKTITNKHHKVPHYKSS